MLNDIQTKELAEFLGVHVSFVSQIKTGRRKLPAKYCLRVQSRYGIPAHELRPDIFGCESVA